MRININIDSGRSRVAALGALLVVGALAGCAGRLPEPSVADAARAAKTWPGTTVSDLHRGKQQYVQRCAGCHGLIDPHHFQAGRWPGFVKEMSGRLKLSGEDVADLTRYLVVAAESPTAP